MNGNSHRGKGRPLAMELRVTKGRAGKKRREEGFTLTELSIVIIILGIILALAALNISNISGGIKLNAARKQVEAALFRAKTAARQENVTYSMIIYPAGNADNPNSYEFMHNVLVDGEWEMTPVDLTVSSESVVEESGRRVVQIGGNVQISGEGAEVTFRPTGTLMQVTPASIVMSSGSQTGTVSIDALGRVTVD